MLASPPAAAQGRNRRVLAVALGPLSPGQLVLNPGLRRGWSRGGGGWGGSNHPQAAELSHNRLFGPSPGSPGFPAAGGALFSAKL